MTMAWGTGYVGVFVILVAVHSALSALPQSFKIDLGNFKVKVEDESLLAGFDVSASLGEGEQEREKTGKKQYPFELGVQLINYDMKPSDAKNIGENKVKFGEHTTLELKHTEGEEKCMEVNWISSDNHHALEDCFQLSPHNWFGGPENSTQRLPLEGATFQTNSYVTKAIYDQAICEPYWLNSEGLLIYVNQSVPLFIDQNHHRKDSFCLLAKNAPPYFRSKEIVLKYTLCKFENPRVAHEFAIRKFLGKPSGIPDERMIRDPIWSTWAKYKTKIDEEVVLEYATNIRNNGFNNSQLEIDDFWETCYGSLSFNETTFPNMKRLTSKLNQMGFRTTIWVHPFINADCETHKEAADKGYLVRNTEGNTTTTWWNGLRAGYVDFRNPAAADWFEKRLKNVLSEGGIDSFKFDAGESSWSPQVTDLNGPEAEQPELITRKYVEFAAKFGRQIEVRTGRGTQHLPVFVRMVDRDSKWGDEPLGIHTVITTTLQMNLNGYPFVLPDMVGGNAYRDEKISKELFIRFLQVNVFLPAVQFSTPPWDFDAETIELTKKFMALRYEYVDTIISLMRKTVETGQPVNTPIWWVDPTDRIAHGINSEFMLGENILIAPVLEKGATSRDIYLPKGQWRDEAKIDKPVIVGPVWLTNYPAALDTLPYFTRIASGVGPSSQAALFLLVFFSSLIIIFR
nr:PREDICTED: uncharacterized family 31 glucosidase KIAA1161-like [Bemisia tabaci]